ncbi:zonular occludens toxin family protein [Caldimonas sp. KR1-144]|uniref:zonular occludens toxin family protein n=1 Tax=Caldimonas sp. KR1-144 TaxID=3400911 RepID=UPI003C0B5128
MITLITGAPGAGKSAALVQLLQEIAKGRAIYVDGVPELQVPHFALEDAAKWHEVVPDGAAVVIDEVQRVWRPRGPGQRVPDAVAALETHRHRGLDFFIVTQGPNLVDKNVRALVGRHVHLRDVGVLGRWWYEWPECSESLAWRTAPLKKRYRLPKGVFGLYKSASMHVKPIRSFPWQLGVAVLALAGVAVGVTMLYRSFSTKLGPAPLSKAPSVSVAGQSSASVAKQAVPQVKAGKEPVPFVLELNQRYRPRLALWYHTATVSDGAIEWWEGDVLRERLTFSQIRMMGTPVAVDRGVAIVGSQYVTAWPLVVRAQAAQSPGVAASAQTL